MSSSDNEGHSLAWGDKVYLPQVTMRAVCAGLGIGTVVLFSNFFFGLQTGWVSMMCLPSALLGYALFESLKSYLDKPFTDVENVFVQSVAVAVGTGPLAYGFVGVIPALKHFLTPEESGPIELSSLQLIIWSLGIALFGVFFSVLLRKQVIVKEKLRFPSGSATATLIGVLHGSQAKVVINEQDLDEEVEREELHDEQNHELAEQTTDSPEEPHNTQDENNESTDSEGTSVKIYRRNISILLKSFNLSGAYTLLAYFVPILRDLPIFGTYLAENYLWTFQPSPAYIGQGIIMGLHTVTSMLGGAILGWAILAPLAQYKGWAPGEIGDWKNGGQGWILWISLAIMLADTSVSFLVFGAKAVIQLLRRPLFPYFTSTSTYSPLADGGENQDQHGAHISHDHDAPSSQLVQHQAALIGLLVSSLLCIALTRFVFGPIIPYYAIMFSVVLALFLSVLGVRALGETDLNPVSGIGKISQLVFALIIPRSHPGAVLINLIAGAITEAGAQQAGDLMQDLKTGHLLGASPRAQFYGQVIGSIYSAFLSSWVYQLYESVYKIPGKLFRIPTAVVWIDCSRLVTGEGTPEKAALFSAVFFCIFAVISLIRNLYPTSGHPVIKLLPSGIAVGIGMYNIPSFTIARFIGGCIAEYWSRKYPSHEDTVALIILSSGLVLGEGVWSIPTLFMTSLNVPHF